MEIKNPRVAALLALKSGRFVANWLDQWAEEAKPSEQDLALAREIASGTMRHKKSLDFLLEQSCYKRLKIKEKERWLLRSAAYQHAHLTKVPGYAINNETLKIAKRHCHKAKIPFINAVLRRLSEGLPALPNDLATKYSYPDWFVQRLEASYPEAEAILKQQNESPPLMARRRGRIEYFQLDRVIDTPDLYIQNITQGTLLAEASQGIKPASILDLCAAPGGKTLLLSDLFPNAELYAHDLKLSRLKQNIEKYSLELELFKQGDGPFDLVLVDAPCSNSGVLYRRPEARWRLEQGRVRQLVETQAKLLKQAASLLAPGGHLIYMTCSILPEENSPQHPGLTTQFEKTRLPNADGWEGGYACTLKATA